LNQNYIFAKFQVYIIELYPCPSANCGVELAALRGKDGGMNPSVRNPDFSNSAMSGLCCDKKENS